MVAGDFLYNVLKAFTLISSQAGSGLLLWQWNDVFVSLGLT